jgi:signal transduction histidine kinase
LEPLDLNTVLAELAPGLRGLLGERTKLHTRCWPERLTVPGHRTGLERTLLNLVVHASRQPPSESVSLEIRREGDRAVVLVRGDGQPSDDASLQRLHGLRSITPDELGLGLWLVRCEVLLHGGSLDIDADPAGSTRIRLELPLDRPRS